MADPHDPVEFEKRRVRAERKAAVDEAMNGLAYLARYPSSASPSEIRDAATKAIVLLRPASSHPFDTPMLAEDGPVPGAVAGT